MSADGSVVVLATTLNDYVDDSPVPFVHSELTARNITTGELLWTETFSELVVGTPALGGELSTRARLVVPAWMTEYGPERIGMAGVVVMLDPGTGRIHSRCVLDEYSDGERLMLAGPAGDGFFALGSGGRLCVYDGRACNVTDCVVLQFSDEQGRIDVPTTLPGGLPQDAAARAHAATLADEVLGERYLPHPGLVPVRFDAACYVHAESEFKLIEVPAGKEMPSRVLPMPPGTSLFTTNGECGGPVVALDAAGAMLLYDGARWRSVPTDFR